MLTGKENWPELSALTSVFMVELPGIEPGGKRALTRGDADLATRNNAKVRETTCGYARGVDGVNTTKTG
jgi:hypothetical protein